MGGKKGIKEITMKGVFLTQVLNPYPGKNSYFNRKNLTLKYHIILLALLFSDLAATAQNYNNIEFVENKM